MPNTVGYCDLDPALVFAQGYLGLDPEILLHIFFSNQTKGAFGFFEGLDDDEYQISINSTLNRDDVIETLFHELVHLDQYLRGDFDQELRLWKGKKYDCTYVDLPWEIEAYYHQDVMMEKYRSRRGSKWNLHSKMMTRVTSGNGLL